LSDKILYDITPFTHVDYPGKLAAIAWFAGCNMRCPYCYNRDIVFAREGHYTPQEFYTFLESRIGLLDGVVFSGGEATRHDLIPIAERIRAMGFAIKLDTNGFQPDLIARLIEQELIDTIALDFKADATHYRAVTGLTSMTPFLQTLDLLIEAQFPFEVRTTVHADLLTPETINRMVALLAERDYPGTYYLQPYREAEATVGDIAAPSTVFDREAVRGEVPIVWR
jgi:pyruvate formate lyase activating enzyme